MVRIGGCAAARGGTGASSAVDAEAGGVLACERAARVVLGCEFDIVMGTLAVRGLVVNSQVGELNAPVPEGKLVFLREFAARLVAIFALTDTLLYEEVVVTLEFSVQRHIDDGCTVSFELAALGGAQPIELRVVSELAWFE